MSRTWFLLVGTVGMILALLLKGSPAVAGGEKENVQPFRVTLRSDVEIVIKGKKTPMKADTDIDYTLRRRGREVNVVFDSTKVLVIADGKETMNMTMSRNGLTRVENGVTRKIRFEDAPEPLKEMLKDSFGVPVCKITLDPNGRETKRVVTAEPGAKVLVQQGLIAATRLFHSPFPSDENRWTAPAEMAMAGGNYVRGQLTYEKIGRPQDMLARVKVSGRLTNDSAKLPGGGRMTDARYEIRGEQTYDAARREWSSGNLEVSFSYDMRDGDVVVGSAKGTMRVKLQQRDAK